MSIQRILGAIFTLFILIVIAELGYLVVSNNYRNILYPNSTIQTQPAKTQGPSEVQIDKIPSGSAISATDGSSFMLVATLNSIVIEKNKDVDAHILLSLGNTRKQIPLTVHFYEHTSPNSNFTLQEQSTPNLYPVSTEIHALSIDLKDNPQQLIQTVEPTKNPNIVLTFLTPKAIDNKNQQFSSNDLQYRFISSIRDCNKTFLTYIQTSDTTPLSCTPYALQMNIVDTNL